MRLNCFFAILVQAGDMRRLRSSDPARNWIPAYAEMTTLWLLFLFMQRITDNWIYWETLIASSDLFMILCNVLQLPSRSLS